jgi:cellulose synthase/poly-beta-1,6-N-acetylglucosamine synthase-like glycosyltransferase
LKNQVRQLTSDAIATDNFQIIMPVFNEEKLLEVVLQNARRHGYLKHLLVVNDASTDGSKEILDRWSRDHGLTTVHLVVNAKKEGAINKVLEILDQGGDLKPYTVLIDADTRIKLSTDGGTPADQIMSAITFMNGNNLDAMALRVNADYYEKPSASWLSAYSTYFSLQFDCWVYGFLGQLWVINGAGGLFRSEQLQGILRNIKPTFETGDLQITVDLMKMGSRIKLYDDMTMLTYVPDTLVALFAQRRRWERGTIKVLWHDRSFYINQFFRKSFLPIGVVLFFLLYAGVFLTAFGYIYREFIATELFIIFATSSLVIWFSIDVLKGACVALRTERYRFLVFCLSALVNIPVWLCVVMPARLCGGFEAVYQIFNARNN